MRKRARILLVTVGLMVAGGFFGAIAGVAAFLLSGLLAPGIEFSVSTDLAILVLPAMIGAVLGAVAAPVVGWLLLRRVPLGLAFFWATVGTVIGGVIGWFGAAALKVSFAGVLACSGGGLLAAALLLRRRPNRPIHGPDEIAGPGRGIFPE